MARFLVFLKCFFCADVTAILATLTYIVLKLDEHFCDKLTFLACECIFLFDKRVLHGTIQIG